MTTRSAPTDHSVLHTGGPGALGAPRDGDEAPRPARRLAVAALLLSAASSALMAVFATNPGSNVLDSDPFILGHTLLPGSALPWTLLAIALVGVLTAAATLARPTSTAVGRLVAPVAVAEVLGFGLLAQGSGTLSTAGYLVSLVVPLLVVVLGVQLFRTRPTWRIPIAVVGLGVAVGVWLGREAFATQLGEVGRGLLRERWSVLTVLLTLATATVWAGLALVRAWRRGSLHRATAWVTRHRRLFTILAALGPLPYALIRLTWLTPWAQLAADGELTPAVRIQGLALSSGAWLGFALTLGLIMPWGERFPRWFPVLAGRPVPPAVAIVPGGAVAVMLCGAAVPMLLMMGATGALYFPAWFWGPTLLLAVWGYAGHRAGIR